MRNDGRKADQIRPVKITRSFIKFPEGSVFIEMGDTKVICNATVEEKVPPFMKGENKGWVTAEYSMLPRATELRNVREVSRGKIGGRTHEIQRLIGRSLRSVVNLEDLGQRTIWIDCDVIQADGGTRTASITGAYVAMVDAMYKLLKANQITVFPVKDYLAAISVGIVGGIEMLDLNFEEDFKAQVDMNLVMTGDGRLVEIQGTAEGDPFSQDLMLNLIKLAQKGTNELIQYQKDILGAVASHIGGEAADHEVFLNNSD